MKKGLAKFEYFLNKLETLLQKAAMQKNAALWLYTNDARTPLFMLEGLSKLYCSLHNKKTFTNIKAHFKLLEDALGTIDYYDNIARDLIKNKKIPTTVIDYLQAQTREKIQSLNELLVEKKWISTVDNRINKIRKKLSKVDWLGEEKEINAINNFYGEAIYNITEFIQANGFNFKNIETDVHELRRKLRWLSIYPQALKGNIQLSNGKIINDHLNKYLTKDITSSAFNVMPPAGDAAYFLILAQQYFYSLSWLIAALGKIKDNGLRIVAIKEACQQTSNIREDIAYKKTYLLLGPKQPRLQQLLEDAAGICKVYFDEKNLEDLVIGITTIK